MKRYKLSINCNTCFKVFPSRLINFIEGYSSLTFSCKVILFLRSCKIIIREESKEDKSFICVLLRTKNEGYKSLYLSEIEALKLSVGSIRIRVSLAFVSFEARMAPFPLPITIG